MNENPCKFKIITFDFFLCKKTGFFCLMSSCLSAENNKNNTQFYNRNVTLHEKYRFYSWRIQTEPGKIY